ncbi:UDP-N-acetylmuramoyl-L-alanyl-D-glutamate--2,6-diaminopimelate ligase [Bacteriovoracaceae bacterium]|nr:UDP-N-acetylmuramoyl-L-alanyl-D-glutamate--2,6-diaminopimelate ligase [Bacteriovoracaceae bacterium]
MNISNTETFKERYECELNNCDYGLLIINTLEVDLSHLKNVVYVNPLEFILLQRKCCDLFYLLNLNQKKVAITGTNGKTSISHYLKQVCNHNKFNTLTIGTLGVYLNDKLKYDFGLTSPAYIDLRKYLDEFYQADILIIEVSSHALDQSRFGDLLFDLGVWSNLTQDHLDYHKTMNNYFNAKAKIINNLKEKAPLIVSQDLGSWIDKISYQHIIISKHIEIKGLNVLAQKNISMAVDAFYELFKIKETNLSYIEDIPGRFNIFHKSLTTAILDFAHTPDALENVCQQIIKSYTESFIIVFGCGGDRDSSKRALMGKIAQKYATKVIITSDNPRFEDPLLIINDIRKEMNDEDYIIEPNREKAIEKAFSIEAKKVILIAGKGHEDYIDQNGTKIPYSDLEQIKKFLYD